jgi:thioredoxin 1
MKALYFTSKTCAACKKMAPVIDKLIAEGYQIAIIDARIDADIAENYQISSLPTLIVFNGDIEIKRLNGVVSESEIRTSLKKNFDYQIW